ncbi:MAG: helix-turn-helix domain-containing protein [Alphaproteobacteria bacterium]|nr:helix-turn-helix domain-containing protein [Alphaproteobacteria bacterium]
MPRKKIQKLVHLDIDELTRKAEKEERLKKEESLSVGATLKTKRQKKKWEIEDVARKLRIKPIYLEALEEGHYYAFPARTYGVGFLRSYSKLLDLDPDKMTALFNQETNDVKEQPLDMLVMEKRFSLPSLKLLLVVLCFILAIYFVWYGIAIKYYPSTFDDVKLPAEPVVVDPVPDVVEEVPVTAKEIKQEPPKQERTVEKVDDAVFSAPAAFVATNTVWIGLKNTRTNEILVSKKFVKNESFIPETPLTELAVSTGRPKVLDLYINGQKVKTFERETWLPLAGFVEVPTEKE